jgi:hypothetical protein
MDGAVEANNPSSWAWKEVWDLHGGRRSVSSATNGVVRANDNHDRSQCPIGIFVSMGTGLRAPRSVFRKGNPLKKVRALFGKAVGDMVDTEEVHRDLESRSAEHNPDLYYRFNPGGLEKTRLDECKSENRTFNAMLAAWTAYVDQPDVRRSLQRCARELVRHRRSRLSKQNSPVVQPNN